MNVQRIQPHLGPLFAEGHFSRMHLLSSPNLMFHLTSCLRGNREARSSQHLQANRVDFRKGKGNQIRAVNALDVHIYVVHMMVYRNYANVYGRTNTASSERQVVHDDVWDRIEI